MVSKRTFAAVLAVALFWVVPLTSANAQQGCEKKGNCETPSESPKEDPHPNRGNPSPGTPPEEPPGNPNPGNKEPSGATEPPSSDGGSSTDGGSGGGSGGGSAEEPSSSGSGRDGHSDGGTAQPTTGDDTGRASTHPSLAPRPRERHVPTVRPTRGPRRVVLLPTDETGRQFLGGRDVLDVVANASHVAAFPLFLALIVGVFLLVQDRIDRKDPKLADAAKTKDYLIFD